MRHEVDPAAREIDSADLACWLLFFLESHGATVQLTPTQHVHVNLDTMPGLTADVVGRWAPTITVLLPEFREILLARREATDAADPIHRAH
jgi:hypothetical protein